jgi:hypothetical protein
VDQFVTIRPFVFALSDIPEKAPGVQLPQLAHELPHPSTDPHRTIAVHGANAR